jgi:hypothetical protein
MTGGYQRPVTKGVQMAGPEDNVYTLQGELKTIKVGRQ